MLKSLLPLLVCAGVWAAPAPELEKASQSKLKSRGEIVSIGHDVLIEEDETADEVVVVGGSASVNGPVKRGVVVIGGQANVDSRVGGEVVAVGGSVSLGEKARVGDDVVAVGGTVHSDDGAEWRGKRTEVTLANVVGSLRAAGDWMKQGALRLRPFPPGVPWVWAVAVVMLGVYLLIAAALPRPLEESLATLSEAPATALLAGVLGFALAGPFCLLLIISIAGLAALPFFLCLLAAAVIFGKAVVCACLGRGLGEAANAPGMRRPILIVLIGAVELNALYMVPVLGFVAWGLTSALGFGAVLMTLVKRLQRETGVPVAAVPAPVPDPEVGLLEPATFPRADFATRCGAFAIDLLACLILAGMLPFVSMGLAAWGCYQVGLWTWKGTTFGGIVVGIQGIRTDGRPMDFSVALVRHLASYFSAAAGLLGFFWMNWDPERQTWHDKIAGTIVVKVPKSRPLI